LYDQSAIVGLELRFKWNGDLAYSQVYHDAGELVRVAQAKREGLEARGWTAEGEAG
jgi:hypothetical protein